MTEGQQAGFSPAAAEAQDRIRELYAKNPSLMPSNPVTTPNLFTSPPNMITNALPTNLVIRRTTNAAAGTNAPKILLPQGSPNAGK